MRKRGGIMERERVSRSVLILITVKSKESIADATDWWGALGRGPEREESRAAGAIDH